MKYLYFLPVVFLIGCLNSNVRFSPNVTMFKYRSNEIVLTDCSSNSLTNSTSSEGGGKLDATVPMGVK